jgi:DNA-binding transcriptional LysR family regulator
LARHDCIVGPGGFDRESWIFKRRNTVISVDVTGRIQTDAGPGRLASALAGLGIVQASSAMCGAELQSGALVSLLTDYTLEPVDVHAVFPGGPRPSAKVRTFADYLAAVFSASASATS